jgi:glucose/arabinose dehydrogenase
MVRNWALAAAAILTMCVCPSDAASINAGNRPPNPIRPFTSTAVAEFDTPWAIAFLPDGRMLVTEKPGRIFLVTQSGRKTKVANVPPVLASGQNGLLDVATAPDFASSSQIYFTYVEPGEGGRLVLSRAMLSIRRE